MHATDDTAKPVALLARAGAARDRLREALIAAGGRIVLEEDPNQLEPASLVSAAPQVVLVALEPAVEDALERLESVLETPELSLLFEEAELAARREGWEAQRWIRHLAAKLQGHGNVLPPGLEHEDAEPANTLQPGLPPRPADGHVDAPLQFHLDEAQVQAYDLPADEIYEAPASAREPHAEVLSFEELIAGAAQPSSVETLPPPLPPEPVTASVEPAGKAAAAPIGDFSSWSLLDEDGYETAPAAPVAAEPPPALASLLNSELSLVDLDEGAAEGNGAVLLIAGIGGPDAVRRVLAGLPEDFSRPVLVQLRLDGGRYANLVKQMARATPLPVSLADPGQSLNPGEVYILPDVIGVESAAGGLRFCADANDLLQALQADRSAVLMLSGADVAMVAPVLDFAGKGGWVAGQIGEGCYDPAAASQLAVAGMSAGDPEYLAAELAVHCAA
ncbi:chemotaxis protein CheB [Stenotrophomonas terrae]|uniref:chemotaxis protein CheB n=1 Tax=Stenotrophomonas terrae TaxID=405446 RepID=UPI00320915CF